MWVPLVIIHPLQAVLFGVGVWLGGPEAEVVGSDAFVEPQVEEAPAEEVGEADSRLCSASSGNSPTGREWARVWNSPLDPQMCQREKLGG